MIYTSSNIDMHLPTKALTTSPVDMHLPPVGLVKAVRACDATFLLRVRAYKFMYSRQFIPHLKARFCLTVLLLYIKMSLSPPPIGLYPTFDALYTAAQQHAKTAGYALAILKGERRNGRLVKVLVCKRGGRSFKSAVPEASRQRDRNTVKCKCPFNFKARERPDGSWELCTPQSGWMDHNHPAGEADAFPEHRQLDQESLKLVDLHQASGIAPSRTVAVLRQQTKDLPICNRDVYNATAAITQKKRVGKSPAEALIQHFETE